MAAAAHDLTSYALPIFGTLVSAPVRGKLRPGTCEDHHTVPFCGTSVSMLDDICIPTLYDLNFVHCSLKASLSVNFERFTLEGLSYNPGNVKLWESPGTAGGLPWIN